MTAPNTPPARPTENVSQSAPTFPGTSSLPTAPARAPLGAVGNISLGRLLAYAVAGVAGLFMVKAIVFKDPVDEMSSELYQVGAAETAFHAANGAYSASFPALKEYGKINLHGQPVTFEAGRSGYQLIVRHDHSDRQCTLIAGSFKPLGGDPEVTCAAVAAPK